MEKKIDKTLIVTSALCLLPVVLGLTLYSKLPAQIPVHFESSGVPDRFFSKPLAVFGLPAVLAAINIYVHFRLNRDPKAENASGALKQAYKWVVPIAALVLMPVSLFMAMGAAIPIAMIGQGLTGLVIAIAGNYLPKCRRNYTIGIRLPWTLDSEENWTRTHRFAGFVWAAGGLLIVINAFAGVPWATLAILALLFVLPPVYAYLSYRGGVRG